MPLSLLLALVIGGIGGITILLHLLGLSRARKLTDESQAGDAWLREFPESLPERILLNSDQNAALILTDQGPGLVWVMGQDTTARPLAGARVHAVRRGLSFRLPDDGAPRVRLGLAPDEARRWQDMIEGQPND